MVRVQMDVQGCAQRLRERVKAAQGALDAAVVRDTEKYEPRRSGALVASVEMGDGEVRYTAAYARRVYYGMGMRFSREVHPLASAQWFEKAKAAHGGQWTLEAQKAFEG